MKVHKKYIEQTEQLLGCKFMLVGVGNFFVKQNDIATILFLLNNKKWGELESFYNKLYKEVF